MRDVDKFNAGKLGEWFKDRSGKKWRFVKYCAQPTIVMEAEDGEVVTASVDALFAADLSPLLPNGKV